MSKLEYPTNDHLTAYFIPFASSLLVESNKVLIEQTPYQHKSATAGANAMTSKHEIGKCGFAKPAFTLQN